MASHEQTAVHELREMMQELLKNQTGIMSRLDSLSTEVKSLGDRLSHMEKNNAMAADSQSNQGVSATSLQELERIRGSISVALALTNPFNVLIYGIAPRQGQTLDLVYRNFLVDVLQIDPRTAYSMALHVQYLPRMSQVDVHFPVCVTYRRREDRNYVCERLGKQKKVLAGMGIKAEYHEDRVPYMWST